MCAASMAAAGAYTVGGGFWEAGAPDWERTRYLLMFGVAEDHDGNGIKAGLSAMRGRGARVVAVNPARTGYAAIADEWIAIRPGTDGAFVLGLVHELLRGGRVDLEFVVRYTNLPWLVIRDAGGAEDGLFARDADGSIRMATYRTSQKIKNIQRDPKVTLLAETGTEYAQLMGVVIYGEAEIVDDYDLVIDTLLRAGGATGLPNDPEEAAKVRESMHGTASKRYVIHIRPQRIVSWNHAKLKGTY
jgi:anaerobic selenocysteine-containing dehydrogenase